MAAGADTVHGTCIALGCHGVLIRGASGAGKSDLALRCMALPLSHIANIPHPPIPGDLAADGMQLVADDRVELVPGPGGLTARAPAALAGRLEVRGLGIQTVQAQRQAQLALVVDLVPPAQVERLPEAGMTTELMGLSLPYARLSAFETSAPLKVILALWSAIFPRQKR